jgi:hypothetical protein
MVSLYCSRKYIRRDEIWNFKLGCFPFLRALKRTRTRSSGCMDEVTVLAKLHINRELSKVLKKLERQLNGF